MKWFNIPTIIGKNINETRLKLLHFDIMFFHLPLKALKKTGFSFVERFFMEFALSKKLLIFFKYFLMLAMAKILKKSI